MLTGQQINFFRDHQSIVYFDPLLADVLSILTWPRRKFWVHVQHEIVGEIGLALPRGRHHLFPRRSFSATLSSMVSANSRFSRVFSSSSALSRLASETSIPPNLPFHL